jgi:hypothetical protein
VTPYKESKQKELRNSVCDWIVTDGIPFNKVNGKGFRRMMKKVNPQFQPPCYQTFKQDLGYGYQTAKELMKVMLNTTCDKASITTDLWTSCAQNGYIGITLHYLTNQMELRDILLCVESIKYPHTGSHIHETIQNKLNEFNLVDKITTAVTDNGSNMIKAIQEWKGAERIPCSAHTLQLCVIRGLKKATDYIDRFKKLSIFFNSPKQNEKLEEAQAELNAKFGKQCDSQNQLSNENPDENQNKVSEENQLKILRTITEVPTRWGSALASWRRLRELKPAIKRVLADLSIETDYQSKKDYRQLQERMLNTSEWNLLDKLIELFKPIEDATEFLGGQKYCTLSLIYPTIQALKYSYAIKSNDNNKDNNEKNENRDSDVENNNDENDDGDNNESDNEDGNINSINKIVN